MEVKKIDFKTRMYQMHPKENFLFFCDDGFHVYPVRGIDVQQAQINRVKLKKYNIVKWHKENGEIEHLAIDENLDKFFHKLLQITKEDIKGKELQAYADGNANGYERGYRMEQQRIRALPWWKRLFNKF